MKHYILIIGMLNAVNPPIEHFPTLARCEESRQGYVAAGIKVSDCIDKQVSTIDYSKPWNIPPLLKPDGVTPRDTPAIKAFKQGWIEEMQKPEAKPILEQDI